MATSYLTRSASGGNQKTYTISVWIKMGNLYSHLTNQTANRVIITSDISADAENHASLSLYNDGNLRFMNLTSNDWGTHKRTTRKLLDPTSWYHIVCRIDTTQSTADDRVRLYINGVQETSFEGTNATPDQNEDTGMFRYQTVIGARKSSSPDDVWVGNLAHMHICEGYSYAPTEFGETDSTTGEWKAKLNPSVSYGANGAFLKFENAGALGTDSSGEGHTFTVNGDLKQSPDTPSNNFCILDFNQTLVGYRVRYAGTSMWGTTGNAGGVNSTQMMKNGKWYFEVKSTSTNTQADGNTISIQKNGTHANRRWRYEGANAIVGKETGSNGCEGITYQPMTSTPNIIEDGGGGTVNYGVQASANDIIMCAFDLDNGKIWFGKNGTWFNAPSTSNVGNPATGANAGLSFTKGDDFWGVNLTAVNDGANKDIYINFGNGYFGNTAVASGNSDDAGIGTFEYDVPAGFYAICTKNIKDYG